MKVDHQICLHCGACVGSCPTNSIFLLETSVIEFLPTCTECGTCEIVCPVGAIAMEAAESFPEHPEPTESVGEVRL